MASEANTVTPPDFTGVVNQEFFLEPQGGPQDPVSYLDRFPETIYNKGQDSVLVALMYTLLGPAGIGWLRQNYLKARLEVEANGLSTANLDELYANPLSFARTAAETYENDPEGLLTNAEWEKVNESDAAYRNRAIDYLKAVRAGGTLQGITLAAKSGLNMPVEVVENYRALYDNFSDSPLGLEWMGLTRSTEEVIVLPRQNRPQSAVQTISFSSPAVQGFFTIALPMGSETNSTTGELAYNITRNLVQQALEALPVIGKNNVIVTGGPLPDAAIEVSFTGELADREIPELLVRPIPTGPNAMLNAEGELVHALVEVDQVGVGADGEIASIPPINWHYATKAIDNIKPMTTIVTPGKAPGVTQRQVANGTFTGSAFTQVLRYVTGSTSIKWPPTSATNWIVAGKEKEAPVSQYGSKSNYVGYHNVANIVAYTQHALEDANYETAQWPTVEAKYKDEQIGTFSHYQQALYPFLAAFKNTDFTYAPQYALANPPSPLTVQSVATNGSAESVPLIEGIYPTSYGNLPGVPTVSTKAPFWSANERTEGTDYLEIDLGTVQAVNFISFEASSKPYNIEVAYDLLDLAPARKFIPVTLIPQTVAQSVTALGYSAGNINPWVSVNINFTNSLGSLIFTRFIRIALERRLGKASPFVTREGALLPYGLEVRNLRVGRNIPS
jgi:hypothetical protein